MAKIKDNNRKETEGSVLFCMLEMESSECFAMFCGNACRPKGMEYSDSGNSESSVKMEGGSFKFVCPRLLLYH